MLIPDVGLRGNKYSEERTIYAAEVIDMTDHGGVEHGDAEHHGDEHHGEEHHGDEHGAEEH